MAAKPILEAYGAAGVTMLQEAVRPYSATGSTVQSIRYEATPDSLTIFGRKFFGAIETGRGPRKSTEYQGFDKSMLEYMAARGIGSDLNQKQKERLAKFLAYKINKEGDDLFKRGGRQVYSDKLQKFVEELKKSLTEDFTKSFINSLKVSFNGSIRS